MGLTATQGVKMLYLIKRKPAPWREELVMHCFNNHMPAVISAHQEARAAGRLHAWRHIATMFAADDRGRYPWDGMAQLWMQALSGTTEMIGIP